MLSLDKEKYIVSEEYTEGLVCFIDILGFSNFVIKEENYNLIRDMFNSFKHFIITNKINDFTSLWNISVMSDSIIISLPVSKYLDTVYFSSLISIIMYLRNEVVDSVGTDIRASITYGKYIHDPAKDIYFGPAIVRAYQLAEHKDKIDELKVLKTTKYSYIIENNPASIVIDPVMFSNESIRYKLLLDAINFERSNRYLNLSINDTCIYFVNPYYNQDMYVAFKYDGNYVKFIEETKKVLDKYAETKLAIKYQLNNELLSYLENPNKRIDLEIINICQKVYDEYKADENEIMLYKEHPHLFVLACVMDSQISADKAWSIPKLIAEELGGRDFTLFANKTLDYYIDLFEERKYHRYNTVMAKAFYNAIQIIKDKYNGDASLIWRGEPTSSELVCRFLEFDRVGIKIATMAANLLTRDHKVKLKDYYAIDISPDIHVKRTMYRLGYLKERDNVDFSKIDASEVIYKAKSINPEFPGLLDLAFWKIGYEKICTNTKCNEEKCPFKRLCKKQGIELC